MYIRTNGRIVNLDSVKYIKAALKGDMSGEPSIVICFEFGKSCDKTLEISYPDYPAVERQLDNLHEAIRAGVNIFDMR